MEMVKVKVSELIGNALNWAVAKAEQHDSEIGRAVVFGKPKEFIVIESSKSLCVQRGIYSPSTNWAHGGPLIEKYKIEHEFNYPGCEAFIYEDDSDLQKAWGHGDNLLEAVCKTVVMLKFGKEIEVPAVLVKVGD